MSTPSSPERPSRLPLFITVGVIAAIIIIAVVAVFARSGTANFDPESPEGVVQSYSKAVIDGDFDTARSLLHPSVNNECHRDEFHEPGNVRLTLSGTVERGNSVIVNVVVSSSDYEGIFGPNEYQSSDRFVLERDGERWAVADAPWRFYVCTSFVSDEEEGE